MNPLLEKMLGPGYRPRGNVAKHSRRAGVGRTSEFKRIAALPRREPYIGQEDIDALSDWLRVPGGTSQLRPTQARAIIEAHDYQGLMGSMDVGSGKFLVSVLIPTVLREVTKRPILFVPAALYKQTLHEIEVWKKEFWILPTLKVVTYEKLSSVKNANLLDEYAPDLIVLDESHKLKNRKAARTRRFMRYLDKAKDCLLFDLSGTMTERSIKDYAHKAYHALPTLCPVPRQYRELEEWARALDEDVEEGLRVAPGALLDFCDAEEKRKADLEAVRSGFRRRLTETPGVVATSHISVGVSLMVNQIEIEVPDQIEHAFEKLRTTWETPGGEEIDSGGSLWRHARELAVGFYYKWEPEPPKEWLNARRSWNAFVRETLKNNRRGLDSPLQVALAVSKGEIKDSGLLSAWQAVRNTYQYESVPVWIDRFAVDFAQDWALKHGGIVWVGHNAIGKAFDKIPYFGPGKKGDRIRSYEGPCAASINAHGEGKNLVQWSRALVLTPPPGGKVWEQLLGRLHRPKQTADEVVYDVVLNCAETFKSFHTARRRAEYVEQTTGQRQRLQYANVDCLSEADALAKMKYGNALWRAET